MKGVQIAALIWLLIVLAILVVHVLVPQRSGPFALSEVLEPYIVLSAMLAAPLAIRVTSSWGRVAVAVFAVVVLGRYAPGWVSLPSSAEGERLTVVAWNLEAGPDGAQRALTGLRDSGAQLVGLEELETEAADGLISDPTLLTRLPYRVLAPDDGILGMGLLSAYPIIEQETSTQPPFIRALIDPPDSDPFAVIVVHPLPARFVTLARLPIALDTDQRDAAISRIRSVIEVDLAAGRSVVVMGDLNTTEREPAYAEFTSGLRDAHLDAGLGPGFTWRPAQVRSVPLGMLRIDYILATPDFAAASSSVDCALPSDHCRLQATFVRVR